MVKFIRAIPVLSMQGTASFSSNVVKSFWSQIKLIGSSNHIEIIIGKNKGHLNVKVKLTC